MISTVPKWIGNLLEGMIGPRMTVSEISLVTPGLKKIRFEGDLSHMDFQLGYASVIRVSETEYRNYTVAYNDSDKGILEIVFHLHGNGVGCQYIDTLKTGDELRISIPRGYNHYDASLKKHLIFGDETTLGLAHAFMPVLDNNKHEYLYYLELEEKNRNAAELLGLKNVTVFPKNESFRDEKWIQALPIFRTTDWLDANFVLTGNARSVQSFRRVLRYHKAQRISAKGYWLEGKTGL